MTHDGNSEVNLVSTDPQHGAPSKPRHFTAEHFEEIRRKFGSFASWAVWAWPPIDRQPKSGIGDLSVLDISENPRLLSTIHTNYVLVGLNISRPLENLAFANFHDSSSRAQDYKLRRAIAGTKLWGAYMTDLLKGIPEVESPKVLRLLKREPEILPRQLDFFRSELKFLDAEDATLVALGRPTQELLTKALGNDFKIMGMTHYSHAISEKEYRKEVESLVN